MFALFNHLWSNILGQEIRSTLVAYVSVRLTNSSCVESHNSSFRFSPLLLSRFGWKFMGSYTYGGF